MQNVFVQNDGNVTWNIDGECESAELPVFIVNPEGGKSNAVQTVKDNVPSSYEGLPLSKIRFDSYDSEGNISMVAVYERSENNDSSDYEDDEATMSFTAGGGSMHITEAIDQVKLWGDSRIDPGYAIGWNGLSGDDSQVEGVDIPAPNGREVYTKTVSLSKLTTAYKRRIMSMIGKVNSGRFKGWDRGEVMFEDATYSTPTKNQKKVTITFNFAIRPNEKGFKYHGKSIDKEGFEYVWGINKAKTEKNTIAPSVKMTHAYKAQVCQYADFSQLGM